ncbi:jg27891, partial [Pararge aegeria aegeria]
MKSWLETASSMEDGSLSCMLAEPREALLPITDRENLAPRK